MRTTGTVLGPPVSNAVHAAAGTADAATAFPAALRKFAAPAGEEWPRHDISHAPDIPASIALFAIAAHADEREAHVREVGRSGRSLPEGSYGRGNRQAIAARETQIAARLRAVEHAHRTAIERDTTYRQPGPTRALRSPELQAPMDAGLEAEP